jgi:hypothetical protein
MRDAPPLPAESSSPATADTLDLFPSEHDTESGSRLPARSSELLNADDAEAALARFPSESPSFAMGAIAVGPDPPAPRFRRHVARRVTLIIIGAACALGGLSVTRQEAAIPSELPSRVTSDWVALAAPITAFSSLPSGKGNTDRESNGSAVRLLAAPAIGHGRREDIVAVQRALDLYRDAFSSRDPVAVKRVWPAADERRLRQRFSTVDQQQLQFDSCRIAVAAGRSTAWCRGSLWIAIPQRRGRVERREWRFTLQRLREDRWVIATVSPD